MNRRRDAAPPRHAAPRYHAPPSPSTVNGTAPPRHAAPRYHAPPSPSTVNGTGQAQVSGGTVTISLILLAGCPALGTVLALAHRQWNIMLVVLHLGGLALWLTSSLLSRREPFTAHRRSKTVLFTTGALAGVAFGGLHALMGPTGTGPLWKPGITASTVLHALVFAVSVGIAYNAVPEEITLRHTLFVPVRERLGATVAVIVTTVSFTALHLPTWLTSDTSLKGYAWQILHKVLFGLLAGWSVVRLRSMFFALGLHVSGNALALFIVQLQSENLPDFEISWLNAAILLAGAAVAAGLILLLGRRREQVAVLSP